MKRFIEIVCLFGKKNHLTLFQLYLSESSLKAIKDCLKVNIEDYVWFVWLIVWANYKR